VLEAFSMLVSPLRLRFLSPEQQMRRREFITLLGGIAAAAWPRAARAQQPAKVARIGYLIIGSLESSEMRMNLDAFRQGLTELGYIEGQNIVIEYRSADADIERLCGIRRPTADNIRAEAS
jgi:hypothetical protein